MSRGFFICGYFVGISPLYNISDKTESKKAQEIRYGNRLTLLNPRGFALTSRKCAVFRMNGKEVKRLLFAGTIKQGWIFVEHEFASFSFLLHFAN